jgi:hypothetical protein
MRYLAIGALFFLAGCASLNADLTVAEAKCVPTPAMTSFVTCLNAMDAPVWKKKIRRTTRLPTRTSPQPG